MLQGFAPLAALEHVGLLRLARIERAADGPLADSGVVLPDELVPIAKQGVVIVDEFIVAVYERCPCPLPVVVLHHIESLDPAVDDPAPVLDMLLHAAHEVARFIQLALEFLDPPVALLQLVLKLGDADVRFLGHRPSPLASLSSA